MPTVCLPGKHGLRRALQADDLCRIIKLRVLGIRRREPGPKRAFFLPFLPVMRAHKKNGTPLQPS